MIWALRWSVALRTFYRQILSLLYSSFPFGNFRPRLVRALLVYHTQAGFYSPVLFAGHSSQLFFLKQSIRAQLRLGQQWWDCIGLAVKGNKTRVQWRHAVIKLALCGEVKIGVQDIKKSLGPTFSTHLDDFEAKLQAIKNVFVANRGEVSLETLFKMLLSFQFITISFHGTGAFVCSSHEMFLPP